MSTTPSTVAVPKASSTDEVLCPSFFPRVPKQCATVAKTFFDALTADSQYTKDSVDPGVGRVALAKHRGLMESYTACVEKHLTDKQRELNRAPVSYTVQVGAPEGTRAE